MTKFVFVTGGVVSSLGKGIAASSLAAILASRGIRVTNLKLDPYINVDPGELLAGEAGQAQHLAQMAAQQPHAPGFDRSLGVEHFLTIAGQAGWGHANERHTVLGPAWPSAA